MFSNKIITNIDVLNMKIEYWIINQGNATLIVSIDHDYYGRSVSKVQSQIAFLVALAKATYLTSTKEVAIVACFLD